MILDRELTPLRLANAVMILVGDAERRTKMAANARALGRPEAASRVALECERLLDSGTRVSGTAAS